MISRHSISLFNKYWEKLYVFVYKKLQSEDDAKDIIQNVFIAVWIKRCQIDIQTTLENYLFSVTRYQLLSFANTIHQVQTKAGSASLHCASRF